jgi:regulatory protein YycH of two-component signal transduction system YycFG
VKDRGRRTEGGEWELNQILLQESAYVPSSNPKAKTLQEGDEHINQHLRNDHLEVTNAVEKESDQLDTRLVKYSQNSKQRSG